MRRFYHPARPTNPYPHRPDAVAGFRYEGALTLLRLKDAVRLRASEDAATTGE